jgi:hypothetical protein
MVHKHGLWVILLGLVVALTASAYPLAQESERRGIPWWASVLIALVVLAFVAYVIWWWLHRKEEPEVAVPEVKAPAMPAVPDDLKLIEGIGPKIAGVLNAAGITTFAQLAGLDPDRIRKILGLADARLIRLADPTTWPEQARLAAAGEWDAFHKLTDELKGGRRS